MPLSLSDFDDCLQSYAEPLAFDEVTVAVGIQPHPFSGLVKFPALELDQVNDTYREMAFRHEAPVRVDYSPTLFPRVVQVEQWVACIRERIEEWREWWGRRP